MKRSFNFILFLFFFVFINLSYSFADSFKEAYVVELGKIDIGKLFFEIKMQENNYEISITLKNKGLLSNLYRFEGRYKASGFIKNNSIIPSKYSQFWSTKRKERIVEAYFENNMLVDLKLLPTEKESPRIKYIGIKNHFDPLSSFLNILIGIENSKTIDGRRVYSMVVAEKNNKKGFETKKILIEEYVNIWTDHKRNDLEYIEIKQIYGKKEIAMPISMGIKFKGLLYKLTKI